MATIPTPEAGLVISYAYLWHHEHQDGQEEGRKNRPAVIVLPITHAAPADPETAIEVPRAVKQHLGLNDERSWIVVAEGNHFLWPGYDLRKTPRAERYDYGFLPPRFFDQVIEAFIACHKASKRLLTPRE